MSKSKKSEPKTLEGLTTHAISELRDLQAAVSERRLESLKLYKPMPHQDEFHACMISERVVLGGNRCLAGDQKIYDPVAGTLTAVSEIKGEHEVWSWEGGKRVVCLAQEPFIKGSDELFSFLLSNGKEIRGTARHLVMLESGDWADMLSVIGWNSLDHVFLKGEVLEVTSKPLLNTDGRATIRVLSVEFLGHGDVWDFHVPGPNNYIIDGVVNHNSGKSLAGAVEFARALTGQDPYNKYPKEDGICIMVGSKWPHIGMVSYPMLFRRGAFKIIRDLKTSEWRAYDPVGDESRKKEAKPAPPLVPPRFVKEISWVLKSASYCQQVTLVNGWRIFFFSAEGEPPQGFQADLIGIDEDVNKVNWIGEMLARLADRKGRFLWTAMPHSQNDALLNLCDRADKEEEEKLEKRTIVKFVFRHLDNIHIDQEEKEKNLVRWSSLGVDELRMRAEGEFTKDSILMYPSFNRAVHILPRAQLKDGIPPDWTRYVAIDPGHAVMAAVFGAVPPDESMLLIYDELYIRHADAVIWGNEFETKSRDQHFYAFIIDMHGGNLRDLGSGRLPHELYSEQMMKRGIKSEITGHRFIPGCDDIQARASMVRQLLHIQGNGKPKLMVLEGAAPNLIEELRRYKKKIFKSDSGNHITDAPNTRGAVHAVQSLEYLCAFEPKYHQPPLRQGPEPWYVRWLATRKKRQGEESGNYVCLGPTRSGQ